MKQNKALPALLSLGLTTGLAVNPVMAEENTGTGEQEPQNTDGLVLSKKAEIQEDGTYDITMTAYATGTIKTDTVAKPTDIVMVLDTSGSMDETIDSDEYFKVTERHDYQWMYKNRDNLYYQEIDGSYKKISIQRTWNSTGILNGYFTYTIRLGNNTVVDGEENSTWLSSKGDIYSDKVTRIQSMKDAAKEFINTTKEQNSQLEGENQHRISIVEFNYKDSTSELKSLTYVNDSNASALINVIDDLDAGGATAADAGLDIVDNKIFTTQNTERNQVVLFLTDGEPNHQSGFDRSVATTAVNTAKSLKDKGVKIFSVGVNDMAYPEIDPQTGTYQNGSANFNRFLYAVSSTYPTATASTSQNSWSINWGTRDPQNYYYAVKNGADMTSVFEHIQEESKNPSINLGPDAELTDILGEDFVATSDTVVTAKVQDFVNGTVGSPEFVDSKNQPTLSIDDKLVKDSVLSVSGFDYSTNFVAVDDKGERRGQQLVVTIEDVQLKSDVNSINTVLYTNRNDSGIYYNGEIVKNFPQPETTVAGKSVVMDYGKTVRFDQDKLNYDSTWDSRFYQAAKASDGNQLSNANKGNLGFGIVNGADYTVNTTEWKGYDSFLALGIASASNTSFNNFKTDYEKRKNEADPKKPLGNNANVKDRVWTKVSVLPASNVYYDDDFTTNEATERVGITYQVMYRDENGKLVTSTDIKGEWTAQEGSGNDIWTDNPDQNFGYEENQKNVNGDSFGTSHVGVSSKDRTATAEFTFTGTNVDIYSHTDMTSGVVFADLYQGDKLLYTKAINHRSEHPVNEYYQVPTLSFDDKGLEWGTYRVKLKVSSKENTNFVLDGIRVYNPIDPALSNDAIVNEGHSNQNNAKFTSVKDLVLAGNANAAGNGALFVDNNPGTESTGNSGVWETKFYDSIGPENEVYLSKNQGIIIQTNTPADKDIKYRVALRVINNTQDSIGTDVKFTKGENTTPVAVGHSHEMYYDLQPDSLGRIMITNLGSQVVSELADEAGEESGEAVSAESNLLVITKIMAYGEDAGDVDYSMNKDSMIAYAAAFDSLPMTDEDVFVTDPETAENEGTDTEEPDVNDSEEPGDSSEILDPSDVEIKEDQEEDKGIFSWLGNLFGGFGKFFR